MSNEPGAQSTPGSIDRISSGVREKRHLFCAGGFPERRVPPRPRSVFQLVASCVQDDPRMQRGGGAGLVLVCCRLSGPRAAVRGGCARVVFGAGTETGAVFGRSSLYHREEPHKILASAVALAFLTSSVAYAQTSPPTSGTSQQEKKQEGAPIGPDGRPISTGGNSNSSGDSNSTGTSSGSSGSGGSGSGGSAGGGASGAGGGAGGGGAGGGGSGGGSGGGGN